MEVKGLSQGGQTTLDTNAQYTGNLAITNSHDIQNVNNSSSTSVSSEDKNSNKQYSEADVSKAVDKLNKLLEDNPTHVEYEVYGKFRDITIRIVDDNTKEVIQEIPPRKIIDMVDKLCELAGIMIDKKA